MLGNASLAAELQQFTNLRYFNSNSLIRNLTCSNKLIHAASQKRHVVTKSTGSLDLLRTAEQLNPQAPIVALDTVPPFEDWHRHPELLTG